MKGYLTVFFSLSLTVFLGLFLGLIGGALQNLGKMRFECAADVGMNSLLGEFHRELLEQYELLFVDISYGSDNGQIANMEEHLKSYLQMNIGNDEAAKEKTTVWSDLDLEKIVISEAVMASDDAGRIMQRQACSYMRESGKKDAFIMLWDDVTVAAGLESADGMALWSEVMDRISTMEPPLLLNAQGIWEEVALNNPADKVYEGAEAQINGLSGIGRGSGITITPDLYISRRTGNRVWERSFGEGQSLEDRYLFQTYLFDKFGMYLKSKPDSLLEYQIEYILFGESSDRDNRMAAVKRLFNWKFSDAIHFYFNNEAKYREASEIAEALYAVKLKPEYWEPVTHSILYAWAFIQSKEDVSAILQGGSISLTREIYELSGEELDYEEYLWLMLALTEEESIHMRTMDIMEMDIRQTAYNRNFRMDWCLESFRALVSAADQLGAAYEIDRRYGYYT